MSCMPTKTTQRVDRAHGVWAKTAFQTHTWVPDGLRFSPLLDGPLDMQKTDHFRHPQGSRFPLLLSQIKLDRERCFRARIRGS